jgi:branched-chain amino acid transport system ATP-binding protein
MKPMLFLHGITLSFGGLSVIDNLDIQVKRGSRCGLIGPNGAGKTTIFNLLSGIYRATAGEILLDDEPIDDVPLERRINLGIGRTFQNLRLMKHLTVLENIMLGQHWRIDGWRRVFVPLGSSLNRTYRAEAIRAAEALRLGDYIDRLAEGLSYGVQKRIEVARALVAQPRLLLLDEPAAGLNSTERAELANILAFSLPADMTVLIVEHDTEFVKSLCDHAVALNFGRKIAEGDPIAVCNDSAVIEAYLGKDEPADSDEMLPSTSPDSMTQRSNNAA